jgi:hypothetical protein
MPGSIFLEHPVIRFLLRERGYPKVTYEEEMMHPAGGALVDCFQGYLRSGAFWLFTCGCHFPVALDPIVAPSRLNF